MGGACSKDFSTNKLNDKKVHPVDTQKISTRDEDKENQNEETRHNNHFIVNATLKTRMRQKSMGLFGDLADEEPSFLVDNSFLLKVMVKTLRVSEINIIFGGKTSRDVSDLHKRMEIASEWKGEPHYSQVNQLHLKSYNTITDILCQVGSNVDENKIYVRMGGKPIKVDTTTTLKRLFNSPFLWQNADYIGIVQLSYETDRSLYISLDFLEVDSKSRDLVMLNIIEKVTATFTASTPITFTEYDDDLYRRLNNLPYQLYESSIEDFNLDSIKTRVEQKFLELQKLQNELLGNTEMQKICSVIDFSKDIKAPFEGMVPGLNSLPPFSLFLRVLMRVLSISAKYGSTEALIKAILLSEETIARNIQNYEETFCTLVAVFHEKIKSLGQLLTVVYKDIDKCYKTVDPHVLRVVKLSLINCMYCILAIFCGDTTVDESSRIDEDDKKTIRDCLQSNILTLFQINTSTLCQSVPNFIKKIKAQQAKAFWMRFKLGDLVESDHFEGVFRQHSNTILSQDCWWKAVILTKILTPLDVWTKVSSQIQYIMTTTLQIFDQISKTGFAGIVENNGFGIKVSPTVFSPALLRGIILLYDLKIMDIPSKLSRCCVMSSVEDLSIIMKQICIELRSLKLDWKEEVSKAISTLNDIMSKEQILLKPNLSGGKLLTVIMKQLKSSSQLCQNIILDLAFNEIKNLSWTHAFYYLKIDTENEYLLDYQVFDNWVLKVGSIEIGIKNSISKSIESYNLDIDSSELNALYEILNVPEPEKIAMENSNQPSAQNTVQSSKLIEVCRNINPRPILNMDEDLVRNIKNATCNTRQWILEEIGKHFANKHTSVLWMVGESGSGKSTIASLAIQKWGAKNMPENSLILVGYYFFKGDQADRSSLRSMLISVGCQIAKNNKKYIDLLACNLHQVENCNDIELFEKLFMEILSNSDIKSNTNSRIPIIVLDGIDELSADDQILLLALIKTLRTEVKFFVNSRPFNEMVVEEFYLQRKMNEKVIGKQQGSAPDFKLLNLSSPEFKSYHQKDLKLHITNCVTKMETEEATAQRLIESLETRVLKESLGMLWITLSTNVIRSLIDSNKNPFILNKKTDIIDLANNLPHYLDELYETALKSIPALKKDLQYFLVLVSAVQRPFVKNEVLSVTLIDDEEYAAKRDIFEEILTYLRQANILYLTDSTSKISCSHKILSDILCGLDEFGGNKVMTKNSFFLDPDIVLAANKELTMFALNYIRKGYFHKVDPCLNYWSIFWASHVQEFIKQGILISLRDSSKTSSFINNAKNVLLKVGQIFSSNDILKWLIYLCNNGLFNDAEICCNEMTDSANWFADFMNQSIDSISAISNGVEVKKQLDNITDQIIKGNQNHTKIISLWADSANEMAETTENSKLKFNLTVTQVKKIIQSGQSIHHRDSVRNAPAFSFEEHTMEVNSVAISRDKKWLVSGSFDKKIILKDVATGETKKSLYGNNVKISSLGISMDGKLIVSGSQDSLVKVWNADSGECIQEFIGHTGWVLSVSVSDDSKMVASGGGLDDNNAKVWDLASGKEIKSMLHDGWVTKTMFSGKSKLLTGSLNNKFQIWNISTGQLVKEVLLDLLFNEEWLHSISISQSEKYLITGWEPSVRIYDLSQDGKCVKSLKGHNKGSVLAVAISDDGKLAVSGSYDDTARVWDVETGECIKVYRHAGKVTSLDINDEVVVTASGNKVNVWKLSEGKLEPYD